jgi:hypothetical protein
MVDDTASVFVFYNMVCEGAFWEYDVLPEGWWWVGAGSCAPTAGGDSIAQYTYAREEQFNGPADSKHAMRDYISTAFEQLAASGKISEEWKVEYTFSP